MIACVEHKVSAPHINYGALLAEYGDRCAEAFCQVIQVQAGAGVQPLTELRHVQQLLFTLRRCGAGADASALGSCSAVGHQLQLSEQAC